MLAEAGNVTSASSAAPLANRWPKLTNSGAPFLNRTPVDYMKAGGLPAILETRGYVDALRGGA